MCSSHMFSTARSILPGAFDGHAYEDMKATLTES